MKIFHIISDSNIGGAGKCLISLAARIPGIEAALPRGSLLIPELRGMRVPLTETDYLAEKSFDMRAVRGLMRIIKENKPDIVHTHGAFSGKIAAKLYGRCIIIGTRHSVFDIPAGRKFIVQSKRIISGLLNNSFCDCFIAVSPAAKDNLIGMGVDEKKIRVIYNGTEPVKKLSEDEKITTRNKMGINRDDFIVSVIGRLVDVKGHDTVLDAAKLLAKHKTPCIKFLIAGSGPMEAHLKKRVEAERIDNIIFTGFVKDISLICNITNIILNASFGTEATSNSLLEAMSLGVPAVASDFGGNPYVVRHGENGFLFPKKDPEALTSLILSLSKDKMLWDKLSAGSFTIYRDNFTAENMAKKTLELYNECIRRQ